MYSHNAWILLFNSSIIYLYYYNIIIKRLHDF